MHYLNALTTLFKVSAISFKPLLCSAISSILDARDVTDAVISSLEAAFSSEIADSPELPH